MCFLIVATALAVSPQVLDGFGTINHMRTTGPVVFLHCSGATKVIEGISISHLLKLDRVQWLFGSGRF